VQSCDGFLDDVKVDVEHVSVGVIIEQGVASAWLVQSVLERAGPPLVGGSVPVVVLEDASLFTFVSLKLMMGYPSSG
jgi:hypothetical protein